VTVVELVRLIKRVVKSPAFNYVPGVYRGLVVANTDPEMMGRLKVYVPTVHGATSPAPDAMKWATPCAPYGGSPQQGILCLPEVGAGVWIAYENGDAQYPVWMGAWWATPGGVPEAPTEAYLEDGSVTARVVYQNGDVVIVEDAEGLTLRAASDAYIRVTADAIELKVGATEESWGRT
jgi:uncharacterized protein involved in type VI secretion and phage assembly